MWSVPGMKCRLGTRGWSKSRRCGRFSPNPRLLLQPPSRRPVPLMHRRLARHARGRRVRLDRCRARRHLDPLNRGRPRPHRLHRVRRVRRVRRRRGLVRRCRVRARTGHPARPRQLKAAPRAPPRRRSRARHRPRPRRRCLLRVGLRGFGVRQRIDSGEVLFGALFWVWLPVWLLPWSFSLPGAGWCGIGVLVTGLVVRLVGRSVVLVSGWVVGLRRWWVRMWGWL